MSSDELNVGRDWEQSRELVVLWHKKWATLKAENERLKFRCENSAWEHQRTIELLRGRNFEVEQLRARLEKMKSELRSIRVQAVVNGQEGWDDVTRRAAKAIGDDEVLSADTEAEGAVIQKET